MNSDCTAGSPNVPLTIPAMLILTALLGFSSVTRAGDPVACTLVCPANITRNADDGQCSATVSYDQPTQNGNCPALSITCTPPPGSFSAGTTTVVCQGVDSSGAIVAGC